MGWWQLLFSNEPEVLAKKNYHKAERVIRDRTALLRQWRIAQCVVFSKEEKVTDPLEPAYIEW